MIVNNFVVGEPKMIDPALNAAIIASINSIQAGVGASDPITKESLIGLMMNNNATVRAFPYGQVENELEHIIKAIPTKVGPYIVDAYTQAALYALS